MIPVIPTSEPSVFDSRVRVPGQQYLATNSHPSSREFDKHAYWRRVLPELYEAFGGICCYSCHWIPADTGVDNVDHFFPKSKYPQLAYEWANYRLACQALNLKKGTKTDVLDPFQIEFAWFTIDFPSMIVKPHHDLEENLSNRVIATINCLGLNDDDTCLRSRIRWMNSYCRDPGIPVLFLRENAPFIVFELERQGIVDTIREIWLI